MIIALYLPNDTTIYFPIKFALCQALTFGMFPEMAGEYQLKLVKSNTQSGLAFPVAKLRKPPKIITL